MSHTVQIKTAFTDLSCLKKAIKSFGWSLSEQARRRAYNNNDSVVYDLVAVNPHNDNYSYDLGINVKGNKITTHGDFYGGALGSAFGAELCKLKQAYVQEVFTDEYEGLGFMIEKTVDAKGNIFLDAVKN